MIETAVANPASTQTPLRMMNVVLIVGISAPSFRADQEKLEKSPFTLRKIPAPYFSVLARNKC
jgi:hypothetical protein